MTARSRLLGGADSPPPPNSEVSLPAVQTVDSDVVIILAALLCALICVLGLIVVSRCTWIRRIGAANTGLKKKVLKSLPKLTYGEDSAQASKISNDCAICLAEFVAGDEVVVLPRCGHGFHVVCIDTWLGSQSSCPSCRQVLVVPRCQKCGGACAAQSSEPRECQANGFLP